MLLGCEIPMVFYNGGIEQPSVVPYLVSICFSVEPTMPRFAKNTTQQIRNNSGTSNNNRSKGTDSVH
jgi:hypothetical protein